MREYKEIENQEEREYPMMYNEAKRKGKKISGRICMYIYIYIHEIFM